MGEGYERKVERTAGCLFFLELEMNPTTTLLKAKQSLTFHSQPSTQCAEIG